MNEFPSLNPGNFLIKSIQQKLFTRDFLHALQSKHGETLKRHLSLVMIESNTDRKAAIT